jgi:hypothetical protein
MTTIVEFTATRPDGHPSSIRIAVLEKYVRSFLRKRLGSRYVFVKSKVPSFRCDIPPPFAEPSLFSNARLVKRLRYHRDIIEFDCDDEYLMTLHPEQIEWQLLFFGIAFECDFRILESLWAARLQHPFFGQLETLVENLRTTYWPDPPGVHRFLELQRIELIYNENNDHRLRFIFQTSDPFE